jgi:CTP:phosphocholine cytidylyltransferase-like protein/thiamine kinase-like enzyme
VNLPALTCRAVAEAAESGTPPTQRGVAAALNVSLGTANRLVKDAVAAGHLAADPLHLTPRGEQYLDQFKVDNAIMLAAGFGSRFVPLTFETPKGLLTVHGEPMIERQIRQLKAAGISEIIIVVGYLKEQFDYLIDKFGVELVFNPEYATKNNLASLHLVRDRLASSYILMADNWLKDNPFHRWEPDAWLAGLYFEGPTAEWAVKLGPRDQVKRIEIGGADTWALLGPAHFTSEFSKRYLPLLERAYNSPGTEDWYFEHVLKENLAQLPFHLLRQSSDQTHEFENLTELRAFDHSYIEASDNAIMRRIAAALGVREGQVSDIEPLKNGLTNSSFRFTAAGCDYVYRRPQEDADQWIDHAAENDVYRTLAPLQITDELVWSDPATGQRIARHLPGAKQLDPDDPAAVARALEALRRVHRSGLEVGAELDPALNLSRLRSLSQSKDAIQFRDWAEVEAQVLEAIARLRAEPLPRLLTHGDFTASNVMVLPDGAITLIDWELAAMGDPLADLAAFAAAAQYGDEQATGLLELYLGQSPTGAERRRFHTWSAATALVNTLWAEYRQASGTQIGEYPLAMYRHAKQHVRQALGL